MTGDTTWKPVIQLFHNQDKSILHLTLQSDNDTLTNEILGVTPEHPFHVKDKGWVEAGKLEIGDLIDSLANSQVKVTSITPVPEKARCL